MKKRQVDRLTRGGLGVALAVCPLHALAASPQTQMVTFGLIMAVVFGVFGLARLMSLLADYMARISDTSVTVSRGHTTPGNSTHAPE